MNRKNSKKRKRKQNNNKTSTFVFIGIILLICPILLLILSNHFLFEAPNSAWIVFGYVGSFIMGIGLFNLIMSLYAQIVMTIGLWK